MSLTKFAPRRIDWFLLGLAASIGLGLLWPQGAAGDGAAATLVSWVSRYGVAVIFLIYGLTLDPAKLLHGARQVHIHLLVQCSTFALFPLLVGAAWYALPGLLSETAWIGFIFLSALPTTIASAVAMVRVAGGNVSAAIFNTTLSSIVSVLVSPLIVAAFLQQMSVQLPLLDTIARVSLLVLLPLVVGQALRPLLRGLVERFGGVLKPIDRVIILVIVYASFADSVAGGVWASRSAGEIVLIAFGCAVLFAVVYCILLGVGRLARLNREDRICVLYCGAQKSLAVGVPLAPVLFGATAELGLIILPILIYHFGQLVVFGVLAGRARNGMIEAKAA